MARRTFKIFETIARYKKLYEAAEEEMQQPADATEPAPEQPAEGQVEAPAAGDNPEEQAEPENGIFISDIQKAEIAKAMLDALMMEPPKAGVVPENLINVTTDNADDVIKFVQTINSVNAPLSLDNEADENSLAGALKDI